MWSERSELWETEMDALKESHSGWLYSMVRGRKKVFGNEFRRLLLVCVFCKTSRLGNPRMHWRRFSAVCAISAGGSTGHRTPQKHDQCRVDKVSAPACTRLAHEWQWLFMTGEGQTDQSSDAGSALSF
jgi:hypothetical protein